MVWTLLQGSVLEGHPKDHALADRTLPQGPVPEGLYLGILSLTDRTFPQGPIPEGQPYGVCREGLDLALRVWSSQPGSGPSHQGPDPKSLSAHIFFVEKFLILLLGIPMLRLFSFGVFREVVKS